MRTLLPRLRAAMSLGFKPWRGSRGHGPEMPEEVWGVGDLEVGEEKEKFGNHLSRTNDNDLARSYSLTFLHRWMTLHRSCDLLFPRSTLLVNREQS